MARASSARAHHYSTLFTLYSQVMEELGRLGRAYDAISKYFWNYFGSYLHEYTVRVTHTNSFLARSFRLGDFAHEWRPCIIEFSLTQTWYCLAVSDPELAFKKLPVKQSALILSFNERNSFKSTTIWFLPYSEIFEFICIWKKSYKRRSPIAQFLNFAACKLSVFIFVFVGPRVLD